MTQTITAETREKLTKIINAGLVRGLGSPRPGSLCIEAAVCLAMGEPHGSRPSCVEEPDRDFSIGINDAQWSSTEARAKALLPLALAQLGTAGTDRVPWVRRVVEGTIRRILPIAMRTAAKVHPDEQHRAALEAAAVCCEQEGTRDAANAANAAANAANAAHAHAHAYAANAANAAHAAYAATADVDAAAAYAARAYAANAADAARAANAAHAAYAAAYATAAYATADAAYAADRDDVLCLAVQIALDAYAAEGRA